MSGHIKKVEVCTDCGDPLKVEICNQPEVADIVQCGPDGSPIQLKNVGTAYVPNSVFVGFGADNAIFENAGAALASGGSWSESPGVVGQLPPNPQNPAALEWQKYVGLKYAGVPECITGNVRLNMRLRVTSLGFSGVNDAAPDAGIAIVNGAAVLAVQTVQWGPQNAIATLLAQVTVAASAVPNLTLVALLERDDSIGAFGWMADTLEVWVDNYDPAGCQQASQLVTVCQDEPLEVSFPQPITAVVSASAPLPVTVTQRDVEIVDDVVCDTATGTTLIRRTTNAYLDGALASSSVQFFSTTFAVVPTPAAFTVGACAGQTVDVETDYVCANNVTLRRVQVFTNGVLTSAQYQTANGTIVAAPAAFAQGRCDDRTPECVKWSSTVVGIDNVGTSYAHNYTIELTLSDGSVVTFNQTPTADHTQQINQWVAAISALLDPTFVVEPRCNLPAGCGGFPPPPAGAELPSMLARYVSIIACPNGVVPIAAKITAATTAANVPIPSLVGLQLPLDFTQTPERKGYRCLSCGLTPVWYDDDMELLPVADIPVCWYACAEVIPETPKALCQTVYDQGCDNVGQTNPALFIPGVTRATTFCESGAPTTAYYVADPGDPNALIPYTLVGEFVDCASGLPVSVTTPCDSFEITDLFRITAPTGALKRDWTTADPNLPAGDEAAAEAYLDAFDWSTPPTSSVIQATLSADDANNSPGVLDVTRVDGFITLGSPAVLRWTSSNEGFVRVLVGECCGEPIRRISFAAPAATVPALSAGEIYLPAGSHAIRVESLDNGGTNNVWNVQYSLDGGVTWANGLPPGSILTQRCPQYECIKVKVCEPSTAMYDLRTGSTVVFNALTDTWCKPQCSMVEEQSTGSTATTWCIGGLPAVRYEIDGVVTWKRASGLVFTPSAGDLAAATPGACPTASGSDTEIVERFICAAGVTLVQRTVFTNGVAAAPTYFGLNGAAVAAPAAFTEGPCDDQDVDIETEYVCAAGVTLVRRRIIDGETGALISETFIGSNGATVPTPAVYTQGNCSGFGTYTALRCGATSNATVNAAVTAQRVTLENDVLLVKQCATTSAGVSTRHQFGAAAAVAVPATAIPANARRLTIFNATRAAIQLTITGWGTQVIPPNSTHNIALGDNMPAWAGTYSIANVQGNSGPVVNAVNPAVYMDWMTYA